MLPRCSTILLTSLLLWLASSTGCARYQYSLVRPAESAQMIERRDEIFVQWMPLDYGFRDLNRALGVRIANVSDDPITLIGERSYVVDPRGETHPMHGGTIAPHSFIAFTLPPMAQVYAAPAGPRFGIGMGVGRARGGTFIGTGVGTTWGPGYHGHYATVSPWTWITGDVRVRAVYEIAGERFEHDFVFRRERVN
jgi:hypothetical protein